jgi:small-conductance mechanosensitive channel
MQRCFRIILLLLCFALPATANADEPPVPAEPDTRKLERLIETLENDTAREAFLGDLKALIAAQKAAEAEIEKPVGTQLLETLSRKAEETGRLLAETAGTVVDLPALAGWVKEGLADPDRRTAWFWFVLKLSAIFAAGAIAGRLANWLLARPRGSIETQSADGVWLSLVFALTRSLLELVPVAVFAAAAYGVMTLAAPVHEGTVLALALINATVFTRVILIFARMLLAPQVATMRLFEIADETANYIFLWTRRLAYIVVYGYFLAQAALPMGIPPASHAILVKLLGLLLVLLLVMLVLQNRKEVAGYIRGGADDAFGQLRRGFSGIWHILLIIYLVAVYGVWALELPGGFAFVLRATVLSIVVLAAARGILELARRGVRRGFALSDEQKARFPLLEARANRYLPVLQTTIRVLIYGIAVLTLLDVWGVDVFGWLSSETAQALIARLMTIALIVLIAVVVWEGVSAAIERYLDAQDSAGAGPSQRVQTLLPLLRNVVMVALGVMVALTVLSELGINIGPLIAGAGILGLAIGFGAQTIVKDFITGFFILVEDTVAVGDIVELGSHRGKVEAMSIRSIQLRDNMGQVHRIPFSEVSTTINKSKGFSFARFDIGVGYSEDIDRCMDVIRDLGAELRADPERAPDILDDIDIMGVQELADSAVVIRARIRVRPGKQFSLQRKFNHMLKNRFDAEGIEIPFPHRTVYFGEDSRGEAPPARIRMERNGGGTGEGS